MSSVRKTDRSRSMRDPYVAVNDNSWRDLAEIDARLERGEIDDDGAT